MLTNNESYLSVLGQINLDDLYIRQAFEHYQRQFVMSEIAQKFVHKNCLIEEHTQHIDEVGFCNRTLGKVIPKCRTAEGAAIRGSLQRSGLVRPSGHELFRGCIVFPTIEDGQIVSATGYRIGRIRGGDKAIVYWHKPEPKAFVDSGMAFAKELIHGQTYH
ncbi:hypothetical protein [Shewanella pneumatophori]|uniref:Uncharacterized protein n=1 Tax=Shewanella pneumatophori TaxID=314092 RepID=A0A9X1ZA66_9GAMM|nr:hypothetical protein [Shewanella pneumatophori]MCL1137741.1 hypothetical protein [Shewanella pneumatophori]